jgi:hypothetical protein
MVSVGSPGDCAAAVAAEAENGSASAAANTASRRKERTDKNPSCLVESV